MRSAINIESVLSGLRALLAKELVHKGYSQRDVAEILGITPAAVTLYFRGKRGKRLADKIRSLNEASIIIENLLGQLTARFESKGSAGHSDKFPLILDAAYKIMRVVSGEGASVKQGEASGTSSVQPAKKSADSYLMGVLRARIEQEHLAAQRNMTLAASAHDELSKTIFRQIATDSIRHADIISFILEHPEAAKGDVRYLSSQPVKDLKSEVSQIEAMIRDEESAVEEPIRLKGNDPALNLLLKSIELDEEKHRMLLKGLLKLMYDAG